ncbi:hypothetical protein KIPB_009422, partial [Kipferlia bialata]|eukprot:g9422.t1
MFRPGEEAEPSCSSSVCSVEGFLGMQSRVKASASAPRCDAGSVFASCGVVEIDPVSVQDVIAHRTYLSGFKAQMTSQFPAAYPTPLSIPAMCLPPHVLCCFQTARPQCSHAFVTRSAHPSGEDHTVLYGVCHTIFLPITEERLPHLHKRRDLPPLPTPCFGPVGMYVLSPSPLIVQMAELLTAAFAKLYSREDVLTSCEKFWGSLVRAMDSAMRKGLRTLKVKLGDPIPVPIQMPPLQASLPHVATNYELLLVQLPPQCIVDLFVAALECRHIMLLSARVDILTPLALELVSLLHPLRWCGSLLPLLPIDRAPEFYEETPILCGMTHDMFRATSLKYSAMLAGSVICDLDTGHVSVIRSDAEVESMRSTSTHPTDRHGPDQWDNSRTPSRTPSGMLSGSMSDMTGKASEGQIPSWEASGEGQPTAELDWVETTYTADQVCSKRLGNMYPYFRDCLMHVIIKNADVYYPTLDSNPTAVPQAVSVPVHPLLRETDRRVIHEWGRERERETDGPLKGDAKGDKYYGHTPVSARDPSLSIPSLGCLVMARVAEGVIPLERVKQTCLMDPLGFQPLYSQAGTPVHNAALALLEGDTELQDFQGQHVIRVDMLRLGFMATLLQILAPCVNYIHVEGLRKLVPSN